MKAILSPDWRLDQNTDRVNKFHWIVTDIFLEIRMLFDPLLQILCAVVVKNENITARHVVAKIFDLLLKLGDINLIVVIECFLLNGLLSSSSSTDLFRLGLSYIFSSPV